MAKKRSCRRTVDEDRIHDKAVKLRKMTDAQLVSYIEDQAQAARNEGRNEGFAEGRKEYDKAYSRGFAEGVKRQKALDSNLRPGVREFLKMLYEDGIRGVGVVTIQKLEKAAKEYGYV